MQVAGNKSSEEHRWKCKLKTKLKKFPNFGLDLEFHILGLECYFKVPQFLQQAHYYFEYLKFSSAHWLV